MSRLQIGDRVRVNSSSSGFYGHSGEIMAYSVVAGHLVVQLDIYTTHSFPESWLDLVQARQTGAITLPTGVRALYADQSSTVTKKIEEEVDRQMHDAYWGAPPSYDKELRAKRKERGECEECGTLLPMLSGAWGLGECSKHPKQPTGKQ